VSAAAAQRVKSAQKCDPEVQWKGEAAEKESEAAAEEGRRAAERLVGDVQGSNVRRVLSIKLNGI
jgi:hypothetical protein